MRHLATRHSNVKSGRESVCYVRKHKKEKRRRVYFLALEEFCCVGVLFPHVDRKKSLLLLQLTATGKQILKFLSLEFCMSTSSSYKVNHLTSVWAFLLFYFYLYFLFLCLFNVYSWRRRLPGIDVLFSQGTIPSTKTRFLHNFSSSSPWVSNDFNRIVVDSSTLVVVVLTHIFKFPVSNFIKLMTNK